MLLPPYTLHERVRLIRLYSGMNQSEMSRLLGMTQGWLSKLESGSSELTAEQLFLIRKHFQLSADAVMDGVIPYGDLSRKFGGSIKLPRKYSTDPNCRARVLYGFIQLFEEELGRKPVLDYFRSIRVKPEILANPDFPVNLNLVFEFIRFGMDKKVLGSEASWVKVAEHTLTPMALGLGFSRLSGAGNPVDAFRRFCDLIGQFATDFEPRFSVAGKNSVEIAVSYPNQIKRIRSVGGNGNVVVLSSYTRAMLRTVGQISTGLKIDVSVMSNPEGGKLAVHTQQRGKHGREMLVYRAQWR